MSRRWTRRGLTATSPAHYSALHRVIVSRKRRIDPLDCERGDLPEEGAVPADPEPWWEERIGRILAAATRSERDALAWRAPSHVAAGQAIGRSKERGRQIRRQVAWNIVQEIEAAIERATPEDRSACGWVTAPRGVWPRPEWSRQRHQIDRAVAEYAQEASRV